MLRVPRGFGLVRGIATRPATAGHAITQLDRLGQLEERAKGRVGCIDQCIGNPVPLQTAESVLAIGTAEFGDEALAIVFEATDVQNRNGTRVHASSLRSTQVRIRAEC